MGFIFLQWEPFSLNQANSATLKIMCACLCIKISAYVFEKKPNPEVGLWKCIDLFIFSGNNLVDQITAVRQEDEKQLYLSVSCKY